MDTMTVSPNTVSSASTRLDETRRISPVVVFGLVQALDFLAITLAGYASFVFYLVAINGETAEFGRYGVISLLGAGLYLVLMRQSDAYREVNLFRPTRLWRRSVIVGGAAFAILVGLGFMLKLSSTYSRGWALFWLIFAVIGITALRLGLNVITHSWRRRGLLLRTVAVVGAGTAARDLVARLGVGGEARLRIVGLFDDEAKAGDRVSGHHVLGNVDDLVSFARRTQVDELIIALPLSDSAAIASIVCRLRALPCDIRLSINAIFSDVPVLGVAADAEEPMLEVAERPLKHWNGTLKWIEDRVIGTVMLLVLAPVMAIIALAIRLDTPGPVIFRQERFGYNNQSFRVFKFRTMHVAAEDASGTRRTVPDDSRVTKVGRVLRRFSLDELPQLFNVLAGEMSLIGPRPHVIGMMAGPLPYNDVADYFVRHRVKPGITGWAQVNGSRGEIDTLEKARRRIELDLAYIDNWSLFLDLRILGLTIAVILSGRNAY